MWVWVRDEEERDSDFINYHPLAAIYLHYWRDTKPETAHAHDEYGRYRYDRTYTGAMSPENENPCAKYKKANKHYMLDYIRPYKCPHIPTNARVSSKLQCETAIIVTGTPKPHRSFGQYRFVHNVDRPGLRLLLYTIGKIY